MKKIILFLLISTFLIASQYKFAQESFDYTGDTGIKNLNNLFKNKNTAKTSQEYYQENIALDDFDFMKDLIDIKKMLVKTNNNINQINPIDNNYININNQKKYKNIIFIKNKLNKIKDNIIIQLYDIDYKIISKSKTLNQKKYLTNEYIYYNNTFNNIFYLKNPKNETINKKLRYKNKFKLSKKDKKNIFILYLNENDDLTIVLDSKYDYFSYLNKIALYDEFGNEYLLNYKNNKDNDENINYYNYLTNNKKYNNKYYYKINISNSGLYYLFINKKDIKKDVNIYLK